MGWLLMGLGTAFFKSLWDIFIKRALRALDHATVMFFSWAILGAFFTLVMLFSGIPEIKKGFVTALVITGLINILTSLLYASAIKEGGLNLSLPLLGVTPALMLATSALLIQESPSPWGFGGVLLVSVGLYLLNIRDARRGLLEPFRQLAKSPGARKMLVVAVLFSITAPLNKAAVLASSVEFYLACFGILVSLGLGALVFLKKPQEFSKARKSALDLALIGMFAVAFAWLQMESMTLSLAVYVISLKRLSIVLGALSGWLIFRGEHGPARFAGSVIVVLGALVIVAFP